MWEVTLQMNEKKEFDNFKDACKCLLEHVLEYVQKGVASWQIIETTYWISRPEYDDQPPIMFPVIRDICADLGWVGKGGWIAT